MLTFLRRSFSVLYRGCIYWCKVLFDS